MKVTFPYMGTTVIYKKLFELLGHEVICPPRPTQRTIDLGVKYSPEFACFPYKVITGSYMEAIELGADTVFTSGGHGPCRAGFYSETHGKTLKSMGYDVDVVVFDEYKRDKKYFIENVKRVKGNNSWLKVIKSLVTVYNMAHALDSLERKVESNRAYEVDKGSFTKAWRDICERFDKEVKNTKDVRRLEKECSELLDSIKIRNVSDENKIRIGIVGEIFVVMESSINMNIEEVLNNLGCEVRRSQYLSEWVDHNIWPKFMAKSSEEEILKKGEKYIEIIIGGHAKQTVGHVVDYKDKGFDGVVHLMPFSCLPELVSQSIMPRISSDIDMPVLTLSLDEQSGIANNLTRIEAFIDLIKNKKRKKTA